MQHLKALVVVLQLSLPCSNTCLRVTPKAEEALNKILSLQTSTEDVQTDLRPPDSKARCRPIYSLNIRDCAPC